jgi:hypothetical protein
VFITLMYRQAMEGDGCFLCQEAKTRLAKVIHELRCMRGEEDERKRACQLDYDLSHTSGRPVPAPVLLGHFPLFRVNDAHCDEPDEAPDDEKATKFRPKWDCLSEESTDFLLETLKPRLALTGHTHHGCRTRHPDGTLEWSVSSFSWRNRDNPAFLLAQMTADAVAVEKCLMPQESTVINMYWLAAVASAGLLVKRCWRYCNKRRRRLL